MIVKIHGILDEKHPDAVILDVNGIGYRCHISVNSYDRLPATGDQVSFLTYYHVTETSQELYAFLEEEERIMFRLLISVSGIGPKTAIQLLSAVTPAEFRKRIIASEVGMLTALPGIGPKTARRIIVELKDKFITLSDEDLPIEEDDVTGTVAREAQSALVNLGFKASEVRRVLTDITKKTSNMTIEEIIKQALAILR